MVGFIIGIAMTTITFLIMSYLLLQKQHKIADLNYELIKTERKLALSQDSLRRLRVNTDIFEFSRLRAENEELSFTLSRYKTIVRSLETENNSLKMKLNCRPSDRANHDIIKKAARIAMVNSHPDKGGKTDDFIIFKNLYDMYK